jgi:hypothetical protein
MKRILFEPRSRQMFMLAMEAAGWLNEHLEEWLGEKNVADTLTQGASDGVGFAARRTTKADAMSRRRGPQGAERLVELCLGGGIRGDATYELFLLASKNPPVSRRAIPPSMTTAWPCSFRKGKRYLAVLNRQADPSVWVRSPRTAPARWSARTWRWATGGISAPGSPIPRPGCARSSMSSGWRTW